MSEELNEYKRKKLAEMLRDIEGVSVDDINLNGFTIRNGSKILKLEVTGIEDVTMDQEIREEFRLKLGEKLASIKDRLNQKITEVVQYTTQIRMEAERKERELEDKLRRAQPMPDVMMDHAKKGLSVIKGSSKDELIWLVQGIYWPKTIDNQAIEPKYSKKLLTNITFMIVTHKDVIKGVSTRQPIGLEYFDHYHQQRPDCWGKWHAPNRFKTPNDIINIARQAEAVLENVNSHSLARRDPRGLPRFSTLNRHLVPKKTVKPTEDSMLSQATRRSGISTEMRSADEDVWSL